MVQEKIGSNQSAVDAPKCKYTQRFNKGPGDLTPQFHKHQPPAQSPAGSQHRDSQSWSPACSSNSSSSWPGAGCWCGLAPQLPL